MFVDGWLSLAKSQEMGYACIQVTREHLRLKANPKSIAILAQGAVLREVHSYERLLSEYICEFELQTHGSRRVV